MKREKEKESACHWANLETRFLPCTFMRLISHYPSEKKKFSCLIMGSIEEQIAMRKNALMGAQKTWFCTFLGVTGNVGQINSQGCYLFKSILLKCRVVSVKCCVNIRHCQMSSCVGNTRFYPVPMSRSGRP